MSNLEPLEIRHIDDVLPHLTEGIRVKERDGYTVVDYSYADRGTFSNRTALECRGLKFDASGGLIARPLHKFFNIGEKELPEDIDWSAPHRVYDKLDGSMVHSCILNDALVFMTRGGISSQASMAFDRADTAVKSLANYYARNGKTAVFEFTSPDNRIVVPYDSDCMTLLAIRDNLSGEYLCHKDLADAASDFGVRLVPDFDGVLDHEKFINDTLSLTGVEGYVIAFNDGHRLKIKCQEYAFRHKALATIANEKTVLKIVLEGREDDILPNLTDTLAERFSAFSGEINRMIDIEADGVNDFVDKRRGLDRKSFAEVAKSEMKPLLLPVAFGVLDGKDVRELVVSALSRSTSNRQRLSDAKAVFPFNWNVDDIPVHELQ